MKKINVIDIETYGSERLVPYCLSIMYNGKIRTAYGIGCVSVGLKWIFDNCPSNTIFYAHNLSFDGGIILGHLGENYSINIRGSLIRGGDIYALNLERGYKRIFLRCSAKLFPVRLEEVAQIFNIPGKGFLNHSNISSTDIDDVTFKNNVIRYCERDVLIVHRFLTKYFFSISKYINVTDVYSVSGIGVKIFKTFFNSSNISLSIKIEDDDEIRPAYYGGRCEVFGNPRESEVVLHFDFSGMYTNRLLEDYPIGGYKKSYPKKISKPGFYYVHVYSNIVLPILPYREPTSGKLLFPNGYFRGLYWYEELILFKKNGGKILKIEYSYEFDQIGYPFKNFAEDCSKLRKNSSYDKAIWKLIPNSFIGRLGIKPDEEETIIIPDETYDPRDLNVISDKKINNNWVVRIKKIKKHKNINGNVIFPSIVTSKARILWWKSAKEVEKSGGRLLYCDTDSIFAAFNKENPPLGERHGEIFWDPSKEDTIIEDACFVTSKVYCLKFKNNNILKIKGVSKKYQTGYSLEEIKKNFKEKNSIHFKTQLFQKGFLDMKIIDIYKIIDFGSYDKRIFNEKKDNTTPIFIN